MKLQGLAGAVFGLAMTLACGSALAGPDAITVGVLGDATQIGADVGGKGAELAANMAAADFGGKAIGKPVKVIFADMQEKPEVAASIARQWLDVDHVDAIVDVPSSAVALAVNSVVREKKNAILIVNEATANDLTGKACTPYTIHWADNIAALSGGTAKALTEAGMKTWYFISADFVFGRLLEKAVTDVVLASGGQVLGSAKHPMMNADFSSQLLQAQASKAQVVALANVGTDTINSIKQAAEFHLADNGQNVAGLLVYISDVNSIGLNLAKGLIVTSSYYWDDNPGEREFGKRFYYKFGRMPTKAQAAIYASVTHYLKSVAAAGTDQTDAVMAKFKAMPADVFGHQVQIRADGRVMYDLALWQVKSPEESKGPWDYYKLLRRIPAAEAFKPIDTDACSFLARK